VTRSGAARRPVGIAEAVGGVLEVAGVVLVQIGRAGCRLVVLLMMVRRRQSAVRLAVEVAQRVRVGMHHCWRRRSFCFIIIIVVVRWPGRPYVSSPTPRKYIRRRKSVCGGGGRGACSRAGRARRPARADGRPVERRETRETGRQWGGWTRERTVRPAAAGTPLLPQPGWATRAGRGLNYDLRR